MEPRLVIAYSMILIMVAGAVYLYLRLTRQRRSDRKAWRLEEQVRMRRRRAARALEGQD